MAIKIVVPKAPSPPVLPADLASDLSLVQQHFPNIGAKITQMWGAVALQNYLGKVILDERGGRQGFPMHVLTALMRLHEHHATLMPKVDAGDPWGHLV